MSKNDYSSLNCLSPNMVDDLNFVNEIEKNHCTSAKFSVLRGTSGSLLPLTGRTDGGVNTLDVPIASILPISSS